MAWIPSYLISLGFTQSQMGWLTSLYWLGSLLGTALGSYLSDVIFGGRRRPPILLSNAMGAILQVLWLFFLQSYLGLVPVYLVAIGFCLSLGLACYAPLVMGASSPSHFPVLMGLVATFGAVGGFLGPLSVGRLYDLFQSYTPGFAIFILSNVLIIVVIGLLREPQIQAKEEP